MAAAVVAALFAVGLGMAGPAWGTSEPAGGEVEPTAEHGEQSHISECVIEAVEAGTEAEECVEAPSPILPATNELVWGSISFVVLFFVLAKFGFPAIKKSMDARADRIRADLDGAEAAKVEAVSILDQYQRQLTDAKTEASRIIEAARQDADKIRQDLQRQADAEVAGIRQRATDDINAQAERVKAGLRAEMAQLSIELAEKVVERNLDRDTNLALIESFITQASRPSAN